MFVALLVLVALFAPWIVPYDPEGYFDYDALNAGPSMAHWFGVDALGRDIFSRVVMGARIACSWLTVGHDRCRDRDADGAARGLLPRLDRTNRDADFRRPAGLPRDVAGDRRRGDSRVEHGQCHHCGRVFSILAFAKLVRGNTLALKEMTYVEAVRSLGASDFTIMLRHILPGTVSPIVVYGTMRIGTSIITAASLSFLGMGAQPPTPEWGAMLNEARSDMVVAPHVALFPVLAIFFTVLAFNLLGDGLRDALDPKIDRK